MAMILPRRQFLRLAGFATAAGVSHNAAAQAYENSFFAKDNARSRRVRVIRDYGKYDRREAPQYYPDASGAETIHA